MPWFLWSEFKDYGLGVRDCMLFLFFVFFVFFFLHMCGLVWHHVKVGLRSHVSCL